MTCGVLPMVQLERTDSISDLPISSRNDETGSNCGDTYGDTPLPGFGDLIDFSRYQTGGDISGDTPLPGFGDLIDFSRYQTGGDESPFSSNVHPTFKKQEVESMCLQNMLNMPFGAPAMMQVSSASQGQSSPALPARPAPVMAPVQTSPMQTPMQAPQGMQMPSPFQTPMQMPVQQPMQNFSPVLTQQLTPVQSLPQMAPAYNGMPMPNIFNQMNATPQMHMNQPAPPSLPPQAARDYEMLQGMLATGLVTPEMLREVANAQQGTTEQRNDWNQSRGRKSRSGFGKKNKSNEPREKVFIGGLDGDVTDDMLLQYFTKFDGEVREAAVLRDGATGLSRGFGFVTFAIAVPDGVYGHVHTIGGRRCGVRPYNYTPGN